MSLELYFHPFSSFCHKVLIALYENGTSFEPKIVDLGDEASRAAFTRVWPITKFPVLRDRERDRTVPESSIIIEYLAQHYPGPVRLLPEEPDLALDTRYWDRFFDHYVHVPMQKIVADRLRPFGQEDPFGVDSARALLTMAYGLIDERMATRQWAMGDLFTLADCAAAPALFYASKVLPFGAHTNVARYLERLRERRSYARALAEAEPYRALFPRAR